MRERLELLGKLLSEDGSIWITIDDNEAHYLKVLCDEVFGRTNLIANLTWVKRVSPANDAKYFSSEPGLCFGLRKDKPNWVPNRLP